MAAVNPADIVVDLKRSGVRLRRPAGAGADRKSAGDSEAALVRHISAINRHAQIARRDIAGGEAMDGDAVHGSAELIHQRRGKQMRLAHHPGLIRVIQSALRGCEQVIGSEVVGRRPEVVSADITAEKRVLGADLVIAAADVLILVDVGGQAETGIPATAGGGRQQRRQLEGRRIKKQKG